MGTARDNPINVRYLLFVEHLMDALADPRQAVFVAAGDVQQFQFLDRIGGVLDQIGRRLGIRGRGEPADPCERIEIAQSEVE